MRSPLTAMAILVSLVPACVKINGGAVEISWVVISPSGGGITDCSCADPAIAKVRLVLVGMGGTIDGATPCAGQAQCDFPCQNQTGATQFDIPPTGPGESYEVSVVAVGNDGLEIPGGNHDPGDSGANFASGVRGTAYRGRCVYAGGALFSGLQWERLCSTVMTSQ